MNNLFSHEFNSSPIVCSLSSFLLETAHGHHGLPGPRAAPPVGSASRSGSDPAAILLHATGAGSAWDRAGRKGKACPWWCVFISVVATLAAGSGGWEGRLRLLGSMHRAEAVPGHGRVWLFLCMDTLCQWACEQQTLQSCPHFQARPFRLS